MLYLLLFAIAAVLAWDVIRDTLDKRRNWREVATGQAGIAALRALTGIADRNELVRHFGSPDPDFRFAVSRDRVLQARTPLCRLFGHRGIEIALLALAFVGGAYGLLRPESPIWLAIFGLVALYLATRDGSRLVVLIKSQRQRLEEARVKWQRARDARQT